MLFYCLNIYFSCAQLLPLFIITFWFLPQYTHYHLIYLPISELQKLLFFNSFYPWENNSIFYSFHDIVCSSIKHLSYSRWWKGFCENVKNEQLRMVGPGFRVRIQCWLVILIPCVVWLSIIFVDSDIVICQSMGFQLNCLLLITEINIFAASLNCPYSNMHL